MQPTTIGPERYASAEAKAEGIVAEELRRRGWSEAELGLRAKSDKTKIVLALRLRRETTVTLKWAARRLAMGSWNHVSNLLAAAQKKLDEPQKCKKWEPTRMALS